jgi:hypothetical protein
MLGNRNNLRKINYKIFTEKNSKHLSQFNKKLDGVCPESMGEIFEKIPNY